MKLRKVIDSLDSPGILNFHDFPIRGITSDSKSVKDGFIFVAIKGSCNDGHRFIQEAMNNGAGAVIVQAPESKPLTPAQIEKQFLCQIPKACTLISVSNTRSALAKLAALFFGYPAKKFKIIGITGTNGKTTISYLIENLFKQTGSQVAVIGTINYRFKEKVIPAYITTPGPIDIQCLLAEIKKAGIGCVVMEVSSHALEQDRVSGIDFSYAIFTNLTHDHLDYHLNMELYFKAKAKLFTAMIPKAVSIINIDDSHSKRLIGLTRSKIITYGLNNNAQISARDIRFDIKGAKFIASTPKGDLDIDSRLIGRHNVYNILACIAFGFAEHLELDIIKKAIDGFKPVPGRLERIDCGQDFSVFIDYAHTDDALKNVLTSLKEFSVGKITIVFGCGGNRDKTKRAKMGKVASQLADFVIVTSDNPRDEKPEEIIKDITQGIMTENYKVIPDRKAAIFESLSMAGRGDIILIAGKGHELYQIFKDKAVHFDDREIVRQCLKSTN